MTSLITRKSRLAFVSEDQVRYRGRLRRVVVEVDKQGREASFRLEGTRSRFPLSFAGMYCYAVKLEVAKNLAEKKATRNAKN